MRIHVIRPGELSQEDAQAWRALQAAAPALDSPFLSPGWAQAVERAQGGAAAGARVAIVEDDVRRGFFTARLRGRTAMPLGAPMCDYQGLVASEGLSLDGQRLVQALRVDRLDFSHGLAEQALFAPFLKGTEASHGIDLSNGYAAYATARAARTGLFKDLAKRRRKAERELGPVTFEPMRPRGEVLDQLVAWKRRMMRDTGQTDIFDAGWPLRLLQDLAERHEPGFGGGLFALRIGGRLAAVHLHLLGERTVHAWIIGHDTNLERVSPGLLLFQDILRWMDGTGYDRLDFGPGDYRFKHQFANTRRAIGHGFIGRPSPAALVRAAEYHVRAVAERMPLGRVSALPGKAMRRMDTWRGLR